MFRSWLRLLSLALLTIALTVPLASTAQAKPFPDQIELPAGFRPEGITIGTRATAYLGSLANGDIYAVNLRTGEGSVVSQGLGPADPSVGLKIDNQGRLFVAGGPSGAGRVIDVETGGIIQTYQFTAAPTFINDVVLTRTVAFLPTHSRPSSTACRAGRVEHPAIPPMSLRCL
jgi:hypothetical protein